MASGPEGKPSVCAGLREELAWQQGYLFSWVQRKETGPCNLQRMGAPFALLAAGSWGNYAEGDEVAPLISLGRREGRAARRARRREALKDKRMSTISDKLARKNMVRRLRGVCEIFAVVYVAIAGLH